MIKLVSSGVDSNKNVYPILVDSSGRPYIILDDGSGNTQPAGDAVGRPIFVKLTDGTEVMNVDSSNRGEVVALSVKPDGTNALACMDANTRAGFQKITDGSNEAIIELDDDNISTGGRTLMVICLNYVYDAGGQNWVRMTQP